LCPECREEYIPSPDNLVKIGIPADEDAMLYLPGSKPNCRTCRGLGFFGQVGVFELLEMTEELRRVILENPTPTMLRLAARNQGLLTLREEGLRLVARGITSLDELNRVVG
jgi:type II secretory ATPase GspE/PulE/Tfp pilus assembly ATPase PilB-like protein